MKILIFGAGAVGSLLGAFLARMGNDVSLVGRAWHLDAIEKGGLHVTGLWGEFRTKGMDLYRSASDVPAAKRGFDLVIFTVKSFDTDTALEELMPLVGPETTLLSFQNGLGNIERITRRVSADRFLAGRIITGVQIEPGHVHVTVSADDLVIGALPGANPRFSGEAAAHTFRLARVPARGVGDIREQIWSKAVYNCALNGPCSLLQVPYGKMLDSAETRAQMERIVAECYRAAAAEGIALDPPDAVSYTKLLFGTLIPRTAGHYPSMLDDLRRGRRTEIDALNGAIARIATAHGFEAPENARIARLVREKETTRSI